MKKNFQVFIVVLLFNTKFISAQPVINSFSPLTGPTNTPVILTGNNFNSIATNNIVYFGTTKALVTNATVNSLNVVVPENANYQYISVTDITTQLTSYSLMPFNVTPISCSDPAFFNNYITDTAGSNINSVAIGDLDGDGLTDIVSVDVRLGAGENGFVSILRNISTSGNIAFDAEINYPTRYYPVSIAIGDLDGDGKPELVVANSDSDTVSFFKNISTVGNISFTQSIELLSGAKPYSVAINDLDADGKLDVAVANFNSNSISIFRNITNTGNISFASKIDFTTSNGAYSLAIGDLDGDTKPDLGVSCMSSNKLSVLKNTSSTGAISFAPKIDLITSNSPYVVQMGDVDLDGKLDLAVCNSGSNSVSVFRNTSSIGNLSFAPKVNFTTASGPLSIAIADLDGDGKPELTTSNLNSANNSVFKNTSSTGTVTFDPHVDYTNNSLGWGNTAIGDLNGDSRAELITGGAYNIGILQNECTINIYEKANNRNSVSVFPNPFEYSTIIEFENKQNDHYTFTLYNSLGDIVRKTDNITTNVFKLERNQLKSGIYFFTLSSNQHNNTGKLIIQ
jgi:hypothetical protein